MNNRVSKFVIVNMGGQCSPMHFFCFKKLTIIFSFFFFLFYSGFAQPEKMLLSYNHREKIKKIIFSADGKYVLSADWEKIIVWETYSGNSIAQYSYTKNNSSDFAFSLNGENFLICGSSRVNIYHTPTGRRIQSLQVPGVAAAFFINDSREIVSIAADKISISDLRTEKVIRSFETEYDRLVLYERIKLSNDEENLFFEQQTRVLKINIKTGVQTVYENPALQPGEKISCFVADKESKTVAVAYSFGEILVFNALTGAIIRQIGLPFNAIISTNPGGRSDTVFSYIENGHYDYGPDNMLITTSSKQLISYRSRDLETTDLNTGKRLSVVKFKNHYSKDFIQADDSLLIFINSSSVLVYHIFKKKVISTSALPEKIGLDNIVGEYERNYQYNSHLKKLVVKDSNSLYPVLLSLPGNRIIRRFNKKGVPDIQQAVIRQSDGRPVLFTGYEDYCIGWDLQNAKEIFFDKQQVNEGNYAEHTSTGTEPLFAPSGKWIAIAYNDFFNVFNFNKSNTCKIFSIPDYSQKFQLENIDQYCFSDNDRLMYQQYVKKGLETGILDLTSGRIEVINKDSIRAKVLKISPSGKYAAFMKSNCLYIYDCETREIKKGDEFVNWREELNSIEFSPDEKMLMVLGFEASEIPVFSISDGKIITLLKPDSAEYGRLLDWAFFHPDNKYVYARLSGTVYQFEASSGKKRKISFNYSPVIAVKDYSFWGINDRRDSLVYCRIKDNDEIVPIRKLLVNNSNVIIDNDNLVAISSKGITWYKIMPGDTLAYKAEIYSVDNLNSIYISYPWYSADKKASETLRFLKGNSIFSFEQLDVKYNRPDKVLEAIGNTDTALIKSYRKAWEKRIKKLGIDTTVFRDGYSVPEADFINRDAIEYEQKTGTLRLHIKGIDSTYKLDRFNVWVNEAPLFGQRGVNIKTCLPAGREKCNSIDTTITIKLSQGENRIETSITNVNGTESYRMPLYVNYTPAVKQKEMTRFIGIGIDQFKESNYNLQYSSKDIRDLAVKLKEQYKDNIIIDTLFNENVTTANVKALKQKLQQTSVNDKVIVSYSGHGLLSDSLDYYLSTYDINFQKPEEKGLPYDELENLLDSIPARKKLMLIDACHSGEVDKEEGIAMNKLADSLGLAKGIIIDQPQQQQHVGLKNSFELMQSLFVNVGKSTGATIISAAAGNQFALERGDLKNGVFTYSILEAMNKYPTIKISELKKIVGERVEQLTNGMQKPTSRNETIAVDWSLW
jgi:hypothetical protein